MVCWSEMSMQQHHSLFAMLLKTVTLA